jgi:hypothetical protein
LVQRAGRQTEAIEGEGLAHRRWRCRCTGGIRRDRQHDTDDAAASSETTTAQLLTAPQVPPAPPTSPTVLPRIGQEVRDGKFGFVVTSVNRSKIAGNPTNPYMTTKAQGEFLNVHLTVTNTGDKPQTSSPKTRSCWPAGNSTAPTPCPRSGPAGSERRGQPRQQHRDGGVLRRARGHAGWCPGTT